MARRGHCKEEGRGRTGVLPSLCMCESQNSKIHGLDSLVCGVGWELEFPVSGVLLVSGLLPVNGVFLVSWVLPVSGVLPVGGMLPASGVLPVCEVLQGALIFLRCVSCLLFLPSAHLALYQCLLELFTSWPLSPEPSLSIWILVKC